MKKYPTLKEYRAAVRFRDGIRALVLLTLAAICFGVVGFCDVYQQQRCIGGPAVLNQTDGTQKTVIFRQGDVVSTGAGWIVSTDDGWVELRPDVWGALGHSCEGCRWTPPLRDGVPPPDLSFFGLYGPGTSGAWTACECVRPVCSVVIWGVGYTHVPRGWIGFPADGFTPLFVRESDWLFMWGE